MSDVISGKAAGAAHLTGYQLGVIDERARIIKLLQNERLICSSEKDCWTCNEYQCDCERIIPLINGEHNA